jgi:hypothetical protein
VVGSVVRGLADPELVAMDLLERMGPVLCAALAAELGRLLAELGR